MTVKHVIQDHLNGNHFEIGEGDEIIHIFGSQHEYFTSKSPSNTSSGTMVDKIDATTLIKDPGTYGVRFVCDAGNDTGEKITCVEFSIDGVSVHDHGSYGEDSLCITGKNDNEWQTTYGVDFVTVTTARTIDLNIKYRANGDGGTAIISNAVIEIWRVS